MKTTFIYAMNGFILILICLLVRMCTCCWGSSSTNIGVSTPDPKILVGNDLVINCTLFGTTVNYNKHEYKVDSSMISFKFKNNYYPRDKIYIINETEAQLRVKNATIDDNGIYYCLLNISGVDHNPLVCVSEAKVGYKPQPVKDFKCISFHFRQLICSWTPPYNPIQTRYNLVDRMHPSIKYDYLVRHCGHNPTENSCMWGTDTVPPYRITAKKFTFQLIGENQFGRHEQLYSVDHYSIIIPNKPQNLRSANVTEKSITLLWSPPSYIDIEEEVLERIIYEIRLLSVHPVETNNLLNKPIIIDGIRDTTYSLTDLIPYTKYNISIRCKTIDSMGDKFWSDYGSINSTTESDVPYLAPEIIPESFETVKNTEGNRSIILYWKPISIQHLNAPQFFYRIDYTRSFRRKSRSANHLYENSIDIHISNATYYSFTHMDPNVVYLFKIYGVNEKGVSKNFTEITVDKSENIPHKPTDIDVFSYGNGRYELQWNKPRHGTHSIINYTVFWCPNLRPRPFPCKGAIDWTHSTNTSIAVELPDDNKSNYHFAVSANTRDSSSGMAWASCIVPIDGKLDKIREVYLEVLSATSIKLTWKLDCPAQKRVVESYKILYCKINPTIYIEKSKTCIEKQHSVMISNNLADSHVLTDLEPFSKYKITLVAFTENGPSEASDPEYANTSPDSPEDSPSNLNVNNVNHNSIYLSWSSPRKPNGKISYYEILVKDIRYNDKINEKIHRINAYQCSNECSYNITELRSYKSYQIQVRACVNPSLCSPYTSTLSVKTSQWIPHDMSPPRSENINASFTRISWSPPAIKNGPISYYILKLESTDNSTEPTIFNISGDQNYYYLSSDCDSYTEQVMPYQRYSARVLAVNKFDEEEYVGNYSASTFVNPCFILDDNGFYIIGLIAGSAIGLTLLVIVLYALVRWIKAKLDVDIKWKGPILPPGLERPNLGIKDDNDQIDINIEPFIRTDSNAEFRNDDFFTDISSKHRHDSEETNESKSSVEGPILRNGTNDNNQKFGVNQTNSKIGHGSVSSNSSNGETHVSSDSGAEMDANRASTASSDSHKNIICKSPLSIVDEISPKTSDSSGSQDSGIEKSSVDNHDRKKKQRRRSNADIILPSLPTSIDVRNPLYDSPLNHTVCAYSLLANSEPSLFDLLIKEDDHIVNLTNYYKPEMTKSLGNMIQNMGPNSVVNCQACDLNNTSSKNSTRTTSPIYQYYKFGVRKQVPYKNNVIPDFKSLSPVKKTETNAANNYITPFQMDRILNNSLSPSKSRLARHKEWSQSSYDAEVSSTSSNGENDQIDVINQPVLYSDTSGTFSECEKIQNNSLVDLNHESKPFISPLIAPSFPSQSYDISETLFNPMITMSDELKPTVNNVKTDSKSKGIPNQPFFKNNNGYVTHDCLNQKSANNLIKVKPNIVKNGNGYVSIPDIEMKNVSVPNNNIVNHITQV